MTSIPLHGVEGALVITPEMHHDERGFFCALDVPGNGEYSRWCVARSAQGVIRGLHVRTGAGEAKLVRCSAGSAYDVIVDLRRHSPTYRKRVSVLLDGNTQIAVYIPAGCAHGYQALEDDTDMTYRIDAEYEPGADVLIAWNDPELDISWPLEPTVMTERDKSAPTLAEVERRL
jgi:dTDP-4-dehydrorhamnose 3,5-epimerase